jgi:hypothetical protein
VTTRMSRRRSRRKKSRRALGFGSRREPNGAELVPFGAPVPDPKANAHAAWAYCEELDPAPTARLNSPHDSKQ